MAMCCSKKLAVMCSKPASCQTLVKIMSYRYNNRAKQINQISFLLITTEEAILGNLLVCWMMWHRVEVNTPEDCKQTVVSRKP